MVPKQGDIFIFTFARANTKMVITEVLIPDPYQADCWLVKVAKEDIWSIWWNGVKGRWEDSPHQPGDHFHEW